MIDYGYRNVHSDIVYVSIFSEGIL